MEKNTDFMPVHSKHRTHLKVLTTSSRCFRVFVSLCLCACLYLPAVAEVAEEVDMGMGLGIEPQAMVLINVPLNTLTTYLQSNIDIIPNQTSHGFLIMQNNSRSDAVVQMAVVPENTHDNAPVFTINPTNFVISAASFRTIEYVVTSSALTPMVRCKWKIYAAARLAATTTTATIIEVIGHMPGADSLTEEAPLPERLPSHVLVTVFHDKDASGSLSQDDTGIEGVALCIKCKSLQPSAFSLQPSYSSYPATTTTTGQIGQIVFQYLMPGTYTVSVDINTVPIEYVCSVPIEQTVVVPAGGIGLLSFPWQLSGRVDGLVFIDENRNGLPDSGEQGVRDAVIRTADGLAITSYDGCYRFSGMLSGRYALKLDMESIIDAGYQDYEATTQDTIEVVLQQGQRLKDVNFGIARREKEIEFE